jgi:hypothetical protein
MRYLMAEMRQTGGALVPGSFPRVNSSILRGVGTLYDWVTDGTNRPTPLNAQKYGYQKPGDKQAVNVLLSAVQE